VSAATPPVTGRLEHVDVDGVGLAIRSWGDPTARTVLFWHPLGDVTSGAYLTELAPTLTEQFGVRLVALDGPGFGESPALAPGDYDVDRLAELAWGVADALRLDRPVLMGHSWGGIVLLAAAAARPSHASALVLLDSGHFAYADSPGTHPEWTREERTAALTAGQPTYADRADLVRQLQDDVRRPLTDAYLAGIAPAMRELPDGALVPIVSPTTRAAAQHALLRERPLDRWPALAAADLPVLLLLATEPAPRVSHDVGVPRVRSAHPRADVRLMPGWGHDLIADGGPALAGVIGEWIAGLSASSAG
jgi:pimeloyl-ACP methyl ester carboxylesterase